MKQTTRNYAEVLYECGFSHETVEKMQGILKNSNDVLRVLESPAASLNEKQRVIERIFPAQCTAFLVTLCRHGRACDALEIFDLFFKIEKQRQGVALAELRCVTPPSAEQLAGLESFIKKRFNSQSAQIKIVCDDSLIGGFILTCRGVEFDRSLKNRLGGLRNKLIGEAE